MVWSRKAKSKKDEYIDLIYLSISIYLFIYQSVFQWKMQFNPDPNKQANEVIFSREMNNNLSYPPVKFNGNNITKCSDQKHLGVVLDSKLDFNTHIDQKIKKCNKLIGLMKRLSVHLPRSALLTIYKSFIRPHLIMKIFKIKLNKSNIGLALL